MKKHETDIIRTCSNLLEPPASEVVGKLCDDIDCLQAQVDQYKNAFYNEISIVTNQRDKITSFLRFNAQYTAEFRPIVEFYNEQLTRLNSSFD